VLEGVCTSYAPSADLENNFFYVGESILVMLGDTLSGSNGFLLRTSSVIRTPPFGENTFSAGSGSLRRTASTREQLLRYWRRCI